MQYKHILVTTDLSKESEAAIEATARLVEGTSAHVSLLFVSDVIAQLPGGVLALSGKREEALRKEVEATVRPRLQQLRADKLPDVHRVHSVVLEGVSLAATICDYAKAEGCDLIVISTHGRSGISRAFIGSVAERVVRHAPCDVLVIRPAEAKQAS